MVGAGCVSLLLKIVECPFAVSEIEELLDPSPLAIWFGSSAVPAILSEQAERLSAEKAATLTVKNLLNNLVITILLRLSCERE